MRFTVAYFLAIFTLYTCSCFIFVTPETFQGSYQKVSFQKNIPPGGSVFV